MIKLSANLGFLWNDLPLPDAIYAAKDAEFDAVEFHWPYSTPVAQVQSALSETNLPLLGLNTQRGNVVQGDNGVAAISGRESEARSYIDEALDYAVATNCTNIHVMAGFTDKGQAAKNTFAENLNYACEKATAHGISILIEPLNHYDAPNYHISTLDEAVGVVETLQLGNLKIMFDCYHLQIMQGDLLRCFKSAQNHIGHVQFASVPDRSEPDAGELNYPWLLLQMKQAGFSGPFGAEYKPRAETSAGLVWMESYR